MPVSVTMPRLGESVTEGTVTRWLKAEGDHVDADEPLLEVSTDKVDTEVPSPASGTLVSIKVAEDETVEVGAELAVIGDGGDDGSGAASGEQADDAQSAEPSPDEAAEPAETPQPPSESGEDSQPQDAGEPEQQVEEPAGAQAEQSRPAPEADERHHANGRVAEAPQPPATPESTPPRSDAETDETSGTYVTPLVRKLASEHGVDLSSLRGTGVGGRIRKSDVLAAAQSAEQAEPQRPEPPAQRREQPAPSSEPAGRKPTAPSPAAASLRGRTEPMSRMRQVIAARMMESLQTSAQLTTVVEVDITRIARLREAAKRDFEQREGVKLSFLPFFAVAAIEALKAHPVVNSSIDMDAKTITYHEGAHLGVAVDTERGLAVPVIHDAGDLNLAGLARKIADLAERTRANRVSPDELGGGTFTITNTGSRGALFDTPIINQPQVAILGTGAVVKRPAVVESDYGETIAVRSMVYLALSYDHRVVDGADAARFLSTIKERLEGGNFESAVGLG